MARRLLTEANRVFGRTPRPAEQRPLGVLRLQPAKRLEEIERPGLALQGVLQV
jgi:hypothetical protein